MTQATDTPCCEPGQCSWPKCSCILERPINFVAHVVAEGLVRAIGDRNYVEMQLEHKRTGERFIVHCQRGSKPTPHDKRVAAEKLLKEALEVIDSVGPTALGERIREQLNAS